MATTTASNDASQQTTILRWSDIDKYKFFSFGTVLYSALTITLHPMTVLKTRQQILNSSAKQGDCLLHQHTLRSTFSDLMASSGARGLFRGAGVVVSLAVSARVLYISTLEVSREECQELLDRMIHRFYPQANHALLGPLVASISGGVAGGVAGMAAQCIAVPMDVISQRQMVMDNATFAAEGSAWSVMRSAIENGGGWRALYRGFGLSLFSSLPAGSIWWATYDGSQHSLQHYWKSNKTQQSNNEWEPLLQRGTIQLLSGTSAAFVAATLTQPLDVTRVRLQVETNASLSAIVSDLKATSGLRGFYRGLGPRVTHMTIWGTVLSSAFELLRHISRA